MFKNKSGYIFLLFILIISILTGCGVDNTPGYLQNKSEPSATEPTSGYTVLSEALLEYDGVVGSFSEGLLCVHRSGKYGYIDKTGSVVIPLKFQTAMPFKEGFAIINEYIPEKREDNPVWGVIDKSGEIVIPLEYDGLSSFTNSRAVFEVDKVHLNRNNNNLYGLIDTSGNIIVPAIYNSLRAQSDGTWKAEIYGGEIKFIDKDGNDVLVVGTNRSLAGEGLYSTGIEIDGKWKGGYVNADGDWVIEPVYDRVDDFHEGFALVFVKLSEDSSMWTANKYFINTSGEIIIDVTEYELITEFSEGLCAVQKDDKWGFIDKTGKMVIDLIYDYAHDMFTADTQHPFKDGRARVLKDDKWGMIDKDGTEIIPIIYDRIRYFKDNDTEVYDGYVVAEKDGKQGILDYNTGDIIVPLIYDHIE